MNVFIFSAGILCLTYYIVIIIHAGITADFAWIWPAGTVLLWGWCLVRQHMERYELQLPDWISMAGYVLLAAGICLFTFLLICVIHGMQAKGKPGLEYVVVLGAQVRGQKPSKALKMRLEAARAYARENPDTVLILSGGQGPGEDITEAKCMAEYLLVHGIGKGQMILEERSVSTRENLVFSDQLTGCSHGNCGILSNNFHIYRALCLARKIGYQDLCGIGAKSDLIMQVHYVIRETAALIKEKISGNI